MKRIISVMILCAVMLGVLCACGGDENAAPVQSVAMITGTGTGGVVNSYGGKVVSGETAKLKKDADKTILEVLVAEGDMVKAGDVLFSYDTEAMQLDLDKLYLEKESFENTISAAESEISELESQRASAGSSQQLSYTLQISSREADIREAQYNMALKEKEIANMETAMENAEITSPIAGRVMSVKDEDSADGMGNMGDGTDDTFITVMDVSSYRVEGHINELNLGTLMEGMPVLVRSRMDETQVWTGVISSIDWENPVSNAQRYYYSDDMTNSSKYPFYVTLDSTDGLILGQHIYIEPDYGQDSGGSGLMLPAFYISDAEGEPWVWAANARDKLEKRDVVLGSYNEDLDEYEILSGLDTSDYIAFPDDSLSAGMAVSRYDETMFGGDEYYGDGEAGGAQLSEDFPMDDAGDTGEDPDSGSDDGETGDSAPADNNTVSRPAVQEAVPMPGGGMTVVVG